jgi:hypothetical protein
VKFPKSSILIALASSSALAQELTTAPSENISVSLQLDSRYDTNAFKAQNRDDHRNERQDQLGLAINGTSKGEFYRASLDYRFLQEFYSKDSQKEDINLFANSSLDFGREEGQLGLSIGHRVNNVLNQPDDQLVSDNAFRQEILSITPSISTRKDKPDVITLNGIYVDVNFESAARSDAVQEGAEISWSHRSPRGKQFGVFYREMDVQFDLESLDYELSRLTAVFQSETRFVNYRIEYGREQIVDVNDNEEEGNYFNFEGSVSNYGNRISLAYTQEFSDTSFASGASDAFSGFTVAGDAELQDQAKISSVSARYINQNLCSICQLDLGYTSQQVEFVNNTISNSETAILSAGLSLNLSSKTTVGVGYNIRDLEFDFQEQRNTKLKVLQATARRKISGRFDGSAYIRSINRENVNTPYDSEQIGIKLTYAIR